ncbi:unnamed protein product [Polarella glacialis]|uniref:Uncharacterized protein n=1 Tax=Polarella glacialis TaxID=89957 RepID=A0A813HV46_POLGL|nr:unnamed protein product [Polarella glacialis]
MPTVSPPALVINGTSQAIVSPPALAVNGTSQLAEVKAAHVQTAQEPAQVARIATSDSSPEKRTQPTETSQATSGLQTSALQPQLPTSTASGSSAGVSNSTGTANVTTETTTAATALATATTTSIAATTTSIAATTTSIAATTASTVATTKSSAATSTAVIPTVSPTATIAATTAPSATIAATTAPSATITSHRSDTAAAQTTEDTAVSAGVSDTGSHRSDHRQQQEIVAKKASPKLAPAPKGDLMALWEGEDEGEEDDYDPFSEAATAENAAPPEQQQQARVTRKPPPEIPSATGMAQIDYLLVGECTGFFSDDEAVIEDAFNDNDEEEEEEEVEIKATAEAPASEAQTSTAESSGPAAIETETLLEEDAVVDAYQPTPDVVQDAVADDASFELWLRCLTMEQVEEGHSECLGLPPLKLFLPRKLLPLKLLLLKLYLRLKLLSFPGLRKAEPELRWSSSIEEQRRPELLWENIADSGAARFAVFNLLVLANLFFCHLWEVGCGEGSSRGPSRRREMLVAAATVLALSIDSKKGYLGGCWYDEQFILRKAAGTAGSTVAQVGAGSDSEDSSSSSTTEDSSDSPSKPHAPDVDSLAQWELSFHKCQGERQTSAAVRPATVSASAGSATSTGTGPQNGASGASELPVPGGTSRSPPAAREEFILAVFKDLTASSSSPGLFAPVKSMQSLVSLVGFDGSDNDWLAEYTTLCRDFSVDAQQGFDLVAFTSFVDDNGGRGCYCTDEELQNILQKLSARSAPSVPVVSSRKEKALPGSKNRKSAAGSENGQPAAKKHKH